MAREQIPPAPADPPNRRSPCASTREISGLPVPLHTGRMGRVQQFSAPGRANRRRPLALPLVRGPVPGRQIRRRVRTSSNGSPKRRPRGRRRPSAARLVSASTPAGTAQRVDVMRWVHAHEARGERRPKSTRCWLRPTTDPSSRCLTRDPWWGARPVGERYEGRNVLGRLWMELRQQLRDQRLRRPVPAPGLGRIRVGCLAGATDMRRVTTREAA